MTAEISFKEVKKHKSKKSLWMVIHNDVYDVTKFLEEHPGGEETLLENAGKDASQAFEDVGHSEDARELLKKYKIGTLPAADKRKDIPLNCCKKCKPVKSYSSPCPSCNLTSVPKSESKSWRYFDGSSSSQSKHKSGCKSPPEPKIERRVEAIVVPRERRPRGLPCQESNTLKWALLALAGAIVIGIVLKKTMT